MSSTSKRSFRPLQVDFRVFNSDGGWTRSIGGTVFDDGTVKLNGIQSPKGFEGFVDGRFNSHDKRELNRLVAKILGLSGRTGKV